jgi:hypothetical protein
MGTRDIYILDMSRGQSLNVEPATSNVPVFEWEHSKKLWGKVKISRREGTHRCGRNYEVSQLDWLAKLCEKRYVIVRTSSVIGNVSQSKTEAIARSMHLMGTRKQRRRFAL